jgi:hypothetical protein
MPHSKLIIKQQKSSAWYFMVGCLLVIVFIGVFVIGRYLALSDLKMTKVDLLISQQALVNANAALSSTSENLIMEKQSSEIDLQSNQELANNVKELQQANNELSEELKFYRKIMSPELELSGLTIDSLKISKTDQAIQYHFRLTLIQAGKQMQFLKGELTLKLVGLLDGNKTEIDFRELGTINSKQFQFQFKYFQNIQGFIHLPLGFEPQKIAVLAKTKGLKKNQNADALFSWQPEESQNYVR